MSKKKKKTDKSERKAKVHKELEGFEIKINPLGEITSSYSIEQLNEFLDKNVYDKKLPHLGLEKPGGTKEKDDEDQYHVEESAEEDENPEDFIKDKPDAKMPRKKNRSEDDEDEEDDEEDDDDEDFDDLDDTIGKPRKK